MYLSRDEHVLSVYRFQQHLGSFMSPSLLDCIVSSLTIKKRRPEGNSPRARASYVRELVPGQ